MAVCAAIHSGAMVHRRGKPRRYWGCGPARLASPPFRAWGVRRGSPQAAPLRFSRDQPMSVPWLPHCSRNTS